jgi:hypothetical protein
MARFLARPVIDGKEPLGTMSVNLYNNVWCPSFLSGEYKTIDNFVRYQVRKFGEAHDGWWNVYLGNDYGTAPQFQVKLNGPHYFRQRVAQ